MSEFTFRSLDLRPVFLPPVRAAVVRRWGEDPEATLPERISGPTRERLRRLVDQVEPGQAIPRRDARSLAAMCLDTSEEVNWKARAIALLVELPRALAFPILFRLYQTYYHDDRLRLLLRRLYAEGRGAANIRAERAGALFSETPDLTVAELAIREGIRLRAFPDDFQLDRHQPLCQGVWRGMLLAGSAPWLRTLDADDVRAALEAILRDDAEWASFLTALVLAHSALSWKLSRIDAHPALRNLFDLITKGRYLGEPRERPTKWAGVDPAVRHLVQAWLNQKYISDFFDRVDARPDRKNFWRRAARSITEIHEYSSCNAFAMHIGSLWFIEFGAINNACYPYREENYDTVRDRWSRGYGDHSDPASMKHRRLLFVRPGYEDARLSHSPGWEYRFQDYLLVYCNASME